MLKEALLYAILFCGIYIVIGFICEIAGDK